MSGTANIPFLGPSHESASVFSRIGNSTIRPFQYPESVLWTLQDCKKNEDVNLSKSNPSRPSMRFGIRHEDGSLLNDEEWQAVKSSVGKKQMMSYFKSFHRDAWYKAIEQLEEQQPLLKLCAEHYKAEKTLNQILTARNNGKRRSKGGGGGSVEDSEYESAGIVSDEEGKETVAKSKPKRKRKTIQRRSGPPAPARKRLHQLLSLKNQDGDTSNETSLPPNRKGKGRRLRVESTTASEKESEKKSLKTGEREKSPKLLHVDPSIDNLISIFQADFPQNSFPNHDAALALLQSFKAQPKFVANDPSESLMNLIKETEGADPNDELDEDENGLNWGHRIFSQRLGNLSWQDIGSTVVACRLIAAVIKTCKQARHACAKLGIRGSYISDSYLDRVIDILREEYEWKGAGDEVDEVDEMTWKDNAGDEIMPRRSSSVSGGDDNASETKVATVGMFLSTTPKTLRKLRKCTQKLEISQIHHFLQALKIDTGSNTEKRGMDHLLQDYLRRCSNYFRCC
ncbi:hypothetical protein JOM56_005346 [Amanita muscaria]